MVQHPRPEQDAYWATWPSPCRGSRSADRRATTTPPELSVVIPVLRRGGERRAALRGLVVALEELGRTYEVVVVDDGSRDETFATPRGARGGRPAPEARAAPPQLRADGGDGRRLRPRPGRDRRPDGRRPPERPGGHRAAAREVRRGLRRRQRLAQGPQGRRRRGAFPRASRTGSSAASPASACTTTAARSRPTAPRSSGDAALRRDAPLPARARVPGRGAHHRDSGRPPSADVRQVQVRARPDVQGAARPDDREVPVRLVDEAEPPLRRVRARSSACSAPRS